jgi:hypothetical protein
LVAIKSLNIKVPSKKDLFSYDSLRWKKWLDQMPSLNTKVPGEENLMKSLTTGPRHPEFPHIVATEWFYVNNFSHLGKGDIVFANFSAPMGSILQDHNAGRVLIVELKCINTTNATAKRKKVKDQVNSSMQAWRNRFPLDEVKGCYFTNENPQWWESIQNLDEITVPSDIPKMTDAQKNELLSFYTSLNLTSNYIFIFILLMIFLQSTQLTYFYILTKRYSFLSFLLS